MVFRSRWGQHHTEENEQVIAQRSGQSAPRAIGQTGGEDAGDAIAVEDGASTKGWIAKSTTVVHNDATDKQVYAIHDHIPGSIARLRKRRENINRLIFGRDMASRTRQVKDMQK